MKLRLALHVLGGPGWTVGGVYLKNLIDALKKAYGREVPVYLLSSANRS